MILHLQRFSTKEPVEVSLRCPGCGQMGTFAPLKAILDASSSTGHTFGQRRCPNVDCRAHVFVVVDRNGAGEVVVSYPAQMLDFDSTDIPSPVVDALEEAITCHASHCFTAAAIMVRKTLEELTDDQGAVGSSLRERLGKLEDRALLPTELVQGLDELRLLGNDAAHLELRTYAEISDEAVTLAIEVTKEVLKRVYQSQVLVDKLRSYRKAPS